MNTRLIAASMIALSAAAGSAFAGEIVPVQDHFAASRSRAEVRAEVMQGHAAGITNFAGIEGDASVAGGPARAVPGTLTRAEVRAQATHRSRNAVVNAPAGA